MFAKNFSANIENHANPFAEVLDLEADDYFFKQYGSNVTFFDLRTNAINMPGQENVWYPPGAEQNNSAYIAIQNWQGPILLTANNINQQSDFYEQLNNRLFLNQENVANSDNQTNGLKHATLHSYGVHQHQMNTHLTHGNGCGCCCCRSNYRSPTAGGGMVPLGRLDSTGGNYFNLYEKPISRTVAGASGVGASQWAPGVTGADGGSGGNSNNPRYYIYNGIAYETTDDNVTIYGIRDSGFVDSYKWADDSGEDEHFEAKKKTVKEFINMWDQIENSDDGDDYIDIDEIRDYRGKTGSLSTVKKQALDTLIYFMTEMEGSSLVETLTDNYTLHEGKVRISIETAAKLGAQLGIPKDFLKAKLNTGNIDDYIEENYDTWSSEAPAGADEPDTEETGDTPGDEEQGTEPPPPSPPPFYDDFNINYYSSSNDTFVINPDDMDSAGENHRDWSDDTDEEKGRYLEWLETLAPYLADIVVKDGDKKGVITGDSVSSFITENAQEDEKLIAALTLLKEQLGKGIGRSVPIVQYLDRRGNWHDNPENDDDTGPEMGNQQIAVSEIVDFIYSGYFDKFGYDEYSRAEFLDEFGLAEYEGLGDNDEDNPNNDER
ncbi:MAG: hypothetical protein AAGI66_00050 [Cyanobacteria bacterium P01_H01_bin.74]